MIPRRLGVVAAAAAAATLGAAGSRGAAAQETGEIRLHEDRRTYEVSGSTAAEVWASLVAGARREGEDLLFAWTDVSTEYRTRMVGDREGCRVTGVRVEVRIAVTLPRWTPPPDAPLALRRQWNRYEAAIRRHEEGHVLRARTTARRLRDAISDLTAEDCDALKRRGTAVGEEILAWGRAEQDRYDRETGHGRTQGVRWTIERDGG